MKQLLQSYPTSASVAFSGSPQLMHQVESLPNIDGEKTEPKGYELGYILLEAQLGSTGVMFATVSSQKMISKYCINEFDKYLVVTHHFVPQMPSLS